MRPAGDLLSPHWPTEQFEFETPDLGLDFMFEVRTYVLGLCSAYSSFNANKKH